MDFNRNRLPERLDVDFTPITDFMRKMDSYLHQSFKQLNEHFHLQSFWVDVEETDTHFIVTADLPNYGRDQIRIKINGNHLRIQVEDRELVEKEKTNTNHYYTKQSYKKQERIVTLPFVIPENETKASFRDQKLTITIPKGNTINNKYIDIEG